jgi:hypothetical protein
LWGGEGGGLSSLREVVVSLLCTLYSTAGIVSIGDDDDILEGEEGTPLSLLLLLLLSLLIMFGMLSGSVVVVLVATAIGVIFGVVDCEELYTEGC